MASQMQILEDVHDFFTDPEVKKYVEVLPSNRCMNGAVVLINNSLGKVDMCIPHKNGVIDPDELLAAMKEARKLIDKVKESIEYDCNHPDLVKALDARLRYKYLPGYKNPSQY